MKMSFFSPAFVALLCAALSACASKKEVPETPQPKRINQQPAQWDYKQIREARSAEAAQRPSDDSATDDSQCVVMTEGEMKRGKVQGCRKLDPRLGNGDNAYCCPQN